MIRLQELELVFGQTNARTDGWTDRRDIGNSILDVTFSEKGTKITPQTNIKQFKILETSL